MSEFFQMNAPVDRLRGGLPKVGIRPTIDGRRRDASFKDHIGIRESLEEQTMNMAKAAKELIEKNLRHACGLPVECVIADTTIGGVAEAVACQEKFQKEGVGVSLTVTCCWCYGSETMDMTPEIPKAVWGFNGTERPGAVYLAAVLAAHTQKGLPAFGIYGHDVMDADNTEIPDDVAKKILRFVKAAIAVADIKGKSYLCMGSTAMGIGGSIMNADLVEDTFGMRVEYIDQCEFLRREDLGIYDHEKFDKAMEWINKYVKIGPDKNPEDIQHSPEKKQQVLEDAVKMAIIAKDLMVGNPKLAEMGFVEESCGHNAIAAGFQGQRQWTDHYPNGDILEALLNTTWDWDGIRQPYVVATEDDCCNGFAMMFGHVLTGAAQVFCDVRSFWSAAAIERVTGYKLEGVAAEAGGIIHLLNSGAAAWDGAGWECDEDGKPCMKPWWEVKPEEAEANTKATQLRYADLFYFRGGGYSTDFMSKGGIPCTMVRINIVKGMGYVLQLAEGWSVDLPQEVADTIDKRTDPTWPTTWFVPRTDPNGKPAFKDAYSVMNNWGANHCSLCPGHVGAELITMCSILRIPVCMHNVPEDEIFRPSSWNAFGMDAEGADYRACQNFGKLYKKI